VTQGRDRWRCLILTLFLLRALLPGNFGNVSEINFFSRCFHVSALKFLHQCPVLVHWCRVPWCIKCGQHDARRLCTLRVFENKLLRIIFSKMAVLCVVALCN
jgi:hypothetical protein